MSGKAQLDPVIAEAVDVGEAHGTAHADYADAYGGCPFAEPSVPHRYSINHDRTRAYLDAYEDAVDRYLEDRNRDPAALRRWHEENCKRCPND